MKRIAATPPLNATQRRLLLTLADPRPAARLPVDKLCVADLEVLLTAAKAHGVLPVVYQNLVRTKLHEGSVSLETARSDVAIVSGQSMLLSHFAEIVTAAFQRDRVRFAIVKGPVFANRLYASKTDRPFTDIDILVHTADISRANTIMRELGFDSCDFIDRPGSIYGEFKWQPRVGRNVLIELHANLLHAPKLRGCVSLGYEDLIRIGEGDAEAPAALMLVAALHATFGHQFERLQLLVDVKQAARLVISTGSEQAVIQASAERGAAFAVASALDVVASAFGDPIVRRLADQVCVDKLRPLAQSLISPRVVAGTMDATAHRRSWRRNAYRQMLVLTGTKTTKTPDSAAGPCSPCRGPLSAMNAPKVRITTF